MDWFSDIGRALFGPPAPRLPGVTPLPSSTEDWRVGDQAECIATVHWCSARGAPGAGPVKGEIRVVTAIVTARGARFLGFARYAPATYHDVEFRKVVPRADAQREGEGADVPLSAPQPEDA